VAQLTIESLAYGGDGVAHLDDGRTAFVPGACPGDVVSVDIVQDHGRFVRCEILDVLLPSPERVAPPCPYFGACGGCSWQHVSAKLQLDAKRQAVLEAFRRIGGVADADAIVGPASASPREYGYRNKIELVAQTDSGGLLLGYHKARSPELVPVDSCLLLPSAQARAPKALTGALRYLSGTQDLAVRRVSLRVAANTRDVEIALWTEPGPFPRKAVASTLGQALKATSIVRVLTKGPEAERRIAGVEVLAGNGLWRERLGGRTLAVSAPSFFQANTSVAETLVRSVLEALSPDGTDRVLELFAGAGTFTLPLAERAANVVAVESAGSAVRDLRRNLDSNQLWAEVVGGDAAREVQHLDRVDLALVDPPRAGLSAETISALAATRARRIAYVSCDPATLARDAGVLMRAGYTPVSATPFDLFPQSFHVETLAVFDRS